MGREEDFAKSEAWPFETDRILVQDKRIMLELTVAPGAPRYTTPELAQTVRRDFPCIDGHPCINEKGSYFGCVIESTPLPHLLEHLIIHLETQQEQTDFTFVGTTEWLDETRGKARIELNFTDDLIALCAFRDASDYLRKAVVPYQS